MKQRSWNVCHFFSIIAVIYFLPSSHAGRFGCPTRVQINPCTCSEKSRGLDISCDNAKLEQLREALASIARTKQTIRYLKLRNNRLGILPSYLLMGLDVRHLIAIQSNLTSIDGHAFDSVAERIESLDLTHNSLQKVPSHALKGLAALASLNLNHNRLEILHAEAFKGLHALVRLSLYGNCIKFIDNLAFVGIGSNLSRIDLGANNLTAVPSRPLRNLPLLLRLGLNENHVEALLPEEFAAMGGDSLDVLDLSKNKVQELPARAFMSLSALNSLDLENNRITNVHWQAFHDIQDSLEWLKMGMNWLTEIPAHALRNLSRLKQLDLRGNNITYIKEDDFLPYGKNLKYVYLQDNWLVTVEPSSLMLLDSLENLYLQSNQLTAVPYETYAPVLNTLRAFDIRDNPFECDCRIIWFRDWIIGKGASVMIEAKETRCHEPDIYHEIAVQDIPDSEIPCINAAQATMLVQCHIQTIAVIMFSTFLRTINFGELLNS